MSWLLWSFEVFVAVASIWLVYVWVDVQRRKKRLEDAGVPVINQMFFYGNIFVNLLPKNSFTLWLFPLRFGLEHEYKAIFTRFNTNLFGFASFGYHEVFTNDAKLVKEIGVTRRKEFDKPKEPYDIVRLFGENVVTARDNDGEWKRHRMVVGPAFSEGNNALVAEATVHHMNRILDEWRKKEKDGANCEDVDAEMVRLALAVIGSAGLGVDLTTAVDKVPARNGVMHELSLRDALQNVCKYLLARLLMPKILLYIPFGIFKEVRMCFEEFQIYMKDFCEDRKNLQEVKSVVEKRQEDFKQDTEPFSPSRFEDKLRLDKKRGDLLSNLLVNNTVLTTDEIFGEIFIFLVAGHETTAHTLGWSVRLLAMHPEIQDKLYNEVMAIIPDHDPTYDDYEALIYSKCVFKEALRMFPQVGGLVRWSDDPVELDGHDLPAKMMFTLCITAVLKNEKYWDSPDKFIPERFDSRVKDRVFKPVDPYAYIPFAVGRRTCLGMKFAQVEGVLALSMLVKTFRFEIAEVDKNKVYETETALTLAPKHKIAIVLKRRK